MVSKRTPANNQPKPVRTRRYVTDSNRPSDPQAVAFAKNLNRLLLERGWTQAEFTRRGKVHAPTGVKFERHLVSTWLTGQHLPNPLNLDITAKVFGVDKTELVPESSAQFVGEPAEVSRMNVNFNGMETARLRLDVELPADVAMAVMKLVKDAQSKAK
jgi:transcriptional regulator with XRE-family HTH domain